MKNYVLRSKLGDEVGATKARRWSGDRQLVGHASRKKAT